jgi:type I restriction enzyme M protein
MGVSKMTESNKSRSLYQALWNSADVLRSKMDANEYKSYLLGLVFYKYLSDKMLLHAATLLEEPTTDLTVAQKLYEVAYHDENVKDDLLAELQYDFSYTLEPKLTFTSLVQDIHKGTFQLEDLAQGFRNIEQSSEIFENLFEDVDLYSKKLGATPQKQNQTIADVMKELADLDLAVHEGDVLGDAYEYLIGQFASDSGKKAGEFYTPQAVSKLMTKIVLHGRENQKGFSVYDPTMGSGSLLLNAKKFSNEPGTILYFGQELNTSTYNLARMNMILHGVDIANQHLSNADTLDQDWPTEEPTNFDAVLMNPPYSAKWSADKGFLDDPRFSMYGVLAPKSKADFAFLLHGYYHLKDNGVMAIVLPHGVLFRGNAEGKIRRILLENGAIDTVIGLPANIFYNTSIPTTVIVLKKNRPTKDVLFIDASNEFEKGKNQNILKDEHIEKILEAYIKREDVEKFAHLASFEEIVENDYNLNIPRYVDTFEDEEEISLVDLSTSIQQTKLELQQAEQNLFNMLQELEGTNDEANQELQHFIQAFGIGGGKDE